MERKTLGGITYGIMIVLVICINWYTGEYINKSNINEKVVYNYDEGKEMCKNKGFEFDSNKEYRWEKKSVIISRRGPIPFFYTTDTVQTDGKQYYSELKTE